MDVDYLKSSSTTKEDQMEMMMLMMQMDKLPEFCGPNIDMAGEFPSVDEFSGSSSGTSIGAPSPFFDNPNGIDPSSTVSYVNTHFQDSLSPAPPHTSGLCSNSSRFKSNIGDLSGASSSMSPSQKRNSMAAMREMIFRIAAMQPIHIDPESVKPPKRRNVKISKDPQSVAARHRRERISERIRILQRLVPGGTKMDTASMLDEAIHYVKFLKTQVQSLERAAATRPMGVGFPVSISNANYNNSVGKSYQTSCSDQMFNSTQQMLS